MIPYRKSNAHNNRDTRHTSSKKRFISEVEFSLCNTTHHAHQVSTIIRNKSNKSIVAKLITLLLSRHATSLHNSTPTTPNVHQQRSAHMIHNNCRTHKRRGRRMSVCRYCTHGPGRFPSRCIVRHHASRGVIGAERAMLLRTTAAALAANVFPDDKPTVPLAPTTRPTVTEPHSHSNPPPTYRTLSTSNKLQSPHPLDQKTGTATTANHHRTATARDR